MTHEWIDISPTISPRLAVWPGDSVVSREVLQDMHAGGHITLSTLRTTVHAGSHADAPSHYLRDGRTIDQQPIELYIGPCQVMHVHVQPGQAVTPAMLPLAITQPRLLLATNTFRDPERWTENFAPLSVELIDHLHQHGVRLIGVDTPSVDAFTSRELPVHNRIAHYDMAILEGLVLHHITPGEYDLIALPLKLEGFDGSPVRAVLRPLG